MKKLATSITLPILLLASEARAECGAGSTCVPPEDMALFVKLLREKQCLQSTVPELKFDPLTIVEDQEGHVFVSGGGPLPYRAHLTWCNYEIDATGKLNVAVAKREPETWGFRFRLKAAPSYLPVTAFTEKNGYAGLDLGVLLEPFFLQWGNVNAYVGVRSVGAGIGFDLTRNLGVYAGYAVTWATWQHNPHIALSFALW